jgi:hypothetical protein
MWSANQPRGSTFLRSTLNRRQVFEQPFILINGIGSKRLVPCPLHWPDCPVIDLHPSTARLIGKDLADVLGWVQRMLASRGEKFFHPERPHNNADNETAEAQRRVHDEAAGPQAIAGTPLVEWAELFDMDLHTPSR